MEVLKHLSENNDGINPFFNLFVNKSEFKISCNREKNY